MDNNLPNDPPDQNNNNSTPPPFGSNFNPHSNPVDPNNPYAAPPSNSSNPSNSQVVDPVQSWIAQHQQRDEDGRFVKIPTTQTSSDLSIIPDSPSFTQKLKSIFTWISKIKWKKMTLYIMGASTFIYLVINNPTFQNLVNYYFPNSSPILGRAVSYQGILKSSNSGMYSLVLPDSSTYTLHLKPQASLTNLKKLNEVVVKGNLTWTPYLIENAEIYPLNLTVETSTQNTPTPTSQPTPTILNPSPPSPNPNPAVLPALYPNLTWETPKNKVLTFTSGTRKIEQDVIYIESIQLNTYPQDFISFYTQQLSNSGFKQTLNSSEPTTTSITYSKGNLFLTFGVKNIYSGTGDSKRITGYRAYIEHN